MPTHDLEATPTVQRELGQFSLTAAVEGRWVLTDYQYPDLPSRLPEHPALYCWCLDHRPVYVGETDRLRRRIRGYVNPGPSQQTNIRLAERLLRARTEGKVVELAILADIRLNGKPVPPSALADKDLRRLLEACCSYQLRQEGHELLNR